MAGLAKMGERPRRWLQAHWPVLLIAAALLLFASTALFNLPLLLMLVLGAYYTLQSPRRLLADPALRALLICFLCLWLPQLLALPDAVNPARALKTTASYPRFFFIGVFIILALQGRGRAAVLNLAVFTILSLWVIDALLQFFSGYNLLGQPLEYAWHLQGMFSKPRLGHVLAVFLPFYLEFLRTSGRRYQWAWLLLAGLLAVVLLSGRRAAWVMAAAGSLAYVVYFFIYCRAVKIKTLIAPVLLIAAILAALIWQHEPLRHRIESTLGLFSGELTRMDRATSYRLSLWETAIVIFKDNPLNGIGPRGFRYVYADYAAADNFFLQDGRRGSTHPHQALLEIAVETGLIGLAGFLGFWGYLLVIALQQLRHRPRAFPWLLCAGLAWLPVNAHLAFYGSYWSSLGWWLLCVALAQRRGKMG